MEINAHVRDLFLIRKDIHFLNFGSFGACPKPVFARYQEWQLLLESEPVQFIAFDGITYLSEARKSLAAYLNVTDPDDLVYVTNPSFAINLVARNLPLKEGDEVLATDIEYGACDRTWDFYCKEKGAKYIRQKIQLPVLDKASFIEDFFKGLTPKTKAIFISHITSATGLILPVKEICELAKEKGLWTIVDGAHVPGHLPLDLKLLKADFYTGACHKWMMAPKGCSFLYAKRDRQAMLDPLVVSWGYKSDHPSHSRFLDYHQTQGTRDFSAFLCIPAAIEFMQQYNWNQVAKDCRKLVYDNAPRFYDLLDAQPLAPLRDTFILQLCSFRLPTKDAERIKSILFNQYNIEVPVMRHGDQVFLRYSIQAFNTQADLDQLYAALAAIRDQF